MIIRVFHSGRINNFDFKISKYEHLCTNKLNLQIFIFFMFISYYIVKMFSLRDCDNNRLIDHIIFWLETRNLYRLYSIFVCNCFPFVLI